MSEVASASTISYAHITQAWTQYPCFLRELIATARPKRMLDVGGGAKPAIPLGELRELGIQEYAILDISADELRKAPQGYKKIEADISGENLPCSGSYDLIISRMLAEHVASPLLFHSNIFGLLSPGGRAFHFFATMFSPVYLLNKYAPERFCQGLLRFADPKRTTDGDNDKFPALYRWCYGPRAAQIKRFTQIGFDVDLYRGFFGHGYYNKIPLLRELHRGMTAALLKKPIPHFTSCAYVVLRRPTVLLAN